MIALLLGMVGASALDRPAPLPEPLAPHPFQVEDPQLATLANGLDVLIFPHSEVPLWEVRLVLGVGEYVDPLGKEGLAQLTFDLMATGAGDLSSSDISRKLQILGGRVDSRLVTDSAVITATGIKRNLAETLDIWAEIIRDPTFSDEEFQIAQRRQIGAVKVALSDATQSSRRVLAKLLYGDTYIGRAPTQASLESISAQDVRALHAAYTGPENALLLVGGDFTAEEIVPLLEERIGTWAPEEIRSAPVIAEPAPIPREVVYFIDDPGASQSVITSATVIDRLDGPDWTALEVANQMYGRAFSSRVNLNLREDKGYTYGAKCYTLARHGAGLHTCHTSVEATTTADSLRELRGEVAAVHSDRPLTAEEVATSKDGLTQQWPRRFETIASILNQEFEIWRYGLSEDRLTEYIANVRAVDTAQANAALTKWIVPDATFWLIVGDRTEVMKGLEEVGLPIVDLDRTGQTVAN